MSKKIVCMMYEGDPDSESGLGYGVIRADAGSLARLKEIRGAVIGLEKEIGLKKNRSSIKVAMEEIIGLDIQIFYYDDLNLTRDEVDLLCGSKSTVSEFVVERDLDHDEPPIAYGFPEVEVFSEGWFVIHCDFDTHLETSAIPISMLEDL